MFADKIESVNHLLSSTECHVEHAAQLNRSGQLATSATNTPGHTFKFSYHFPQGETVKGLQ